MWLCCGFYNVSTPPRVKGVFLSENSPSGNSNYEISFTHFFKIFGLRTPPPPPHPPPLPRKFHSLLWGRMDIFGNCA